MSAEHRNEVLRAAAQAKHTTATKRAEGALRTLIKTGAQITFRTVANTAGVSVDFLYRHPELRVRIEHLRSRQQQPPPHAAVPPPQRDQDRSVLVALTARLREARGEITEPKQTNSWARIASGSDSECGSIARTMSPASPVNATGRGGVGQSSVVSGSGITFVAGRSVMRSRFLVRCGEGGFG